MKKTIILTVVFLITFISFKSSMAKPNWPQWVADLRIEALADGIEPAMFDKVFRNLQPDKQVLRFDRSQPEKRISFLKYRNTRADRNRIAIGKREYKRNQKLLEQIGQDFNVDPCFITALWGLESSYGRFLGNFPVIKSLATLAYDSPRSDFFHGELIYALHIVNDGQISLDKFKGEWAGASGQCQFLPSSWYKYAVDYTGDGYKDIWTSLPDAFASIANYLKQNGWQQGQPWAITVKLPRDFDNDIIGKGKLRPVSEWVAMGVLTDKGESLPYQDLNAAIIRPDGGPVFLAFENYHAILAYNNSTYYAGTIGYLADNICKR